MDRPFSRSATPPPNSTTSLGASLLPPPATTTTTTTTTTTGRIGTMERTDSSAGSGGYVTAASQPSQSLPQRELPNPPSMPGGNVPVLEPRGNNAGQCSAPLLSSLGVNRSNRTTMTGPGDMHRLQQQQSRVPSGPGQAAPSLNTLAALSNTTTSSSNPPSTNNNNNNAAADSPAQLSSPTNPFRQPASNPTSLAATLGIVPSFPAQAHAQAQHAQQAQQAQRPPSNASSVITASSASASAGTGRQRVTAESLLEGSLPPPASAGGSGAPNQNQSLGQSAHAQGQQSTTSDRQSALLSLLSHPNPSPQGSTNSSILNPNPASNPSAQNQSSAQNNNMYPSSPPQGPYNYHSPSMGSLTNANANANSNPNPNQSQNQGSNQNQGSMSQIGLGSLNPMGSMGMGMGMGMGMHNNMSMNSLASGPGSGSFSPVPPYALPDSPSAASASSQRNLSGLGMAPMMQMQGPEGQGARESPLREMMQGGAGYGQSGQQGQQQYGQQQQQQQQQSPQYQQHSAGPQQSPPQSQPQQPQQQPQQSQSQSQQGKLLEQLMAIGDLRGAPASVPGAAYSSFAPDPHLSPGSQQAAPPPPPPGYSQQPQSQGQGQGQKSMFDFVSPFDALSPVSSAPSSALPASAPQQQQVQRKAVPQQQQQQSLSPPSAAESASRPLPVPGMQPRARVTSLDITYPPGAEDGRWVRARQDSVTITPIALLKLDSVYHAGTTIGVADFIAYAMTKGRVRLIDRLQGFRALLKLPAPFPNSSTLSDMAVTDTRICATTSDGGLVVWDIPAMESEDPPVNVQLVVPGQGAAAGTAFKALRPYPGGNGDLLGLATSKEVWIVSVHEASQVNGSSQLTPAELRSIARVVAVPRDAELAAFAFSPLPTPTTSSTTLPPEPTLATVTTAGELTFWSLGDLEPRPLWKGTVPGPGRPSSAHFVSTEGLVLGRRQGTVFQLISGLSGKVVEEVRFESGAQEGEEGGPQGFGHVCYDTRLGALWVANSIRPSLFALRPVMQSGGSKPVGFHPALEFPLPEPMINITLASDVAYRGAQEGPDRQSPQHSDNAVTAFAVHTGGVHQVQVGRESWEEMVHEAEALASSLGLPGAGASEGEQLAEIPDEEGDDEETDAQFEMQEPIKAMPSAPLMPVAPPRPEVIRQQAERAGITARPPQGGPQRQTAALSGGSLTGVPVIPAQVEDSAEQSGSSRGVTGPSTAAGGKSKKEKEREKKEDKKEKEAGKEKEKQDALPSALANDPMGAALAREMRRVEESLTSSVTRILGKEMERQQKDFEERRAEDQKSEYLRQEVMLKLISAELTKNTARMVEAAVKQEVQSTVLPALEAIAKSEIRNSVNGQIAKGLGESMRTTLPNEIEKLLLRPDVSNHIARTFSSAVTPLVEKNVKDTIARTLVPAYQQATQNMQQQLMHEIHTEILNVKKEIVGWQSDVLTDVQTTMNSLEQQFIQLSEQLRGISLQVKPPSRSQGGTPTHTPSHLRNSGNSIMPMGPPPSLPQLLQNAPWQQAVQNSQSQQMPPQFQPGPVYGPSGGNQYGPPAAPQQQPMQQQQREQNIQMPQPQQPPSQVLGFRPEDWDEAFLTVLTSGETRQLRELLSKCNADIIMPANGQAGPLSQAVILTIVTRLSTMVSEMSPEDESFDFTLRWLQRAAMALTPSDRVIAPYVQRVLPSVQQTLGNLNQRLGLLPGGPRLLEVSRTLGQISQTLSNKPLIAL
ncbi:hypothetical protein CALCODRAFT_517943 [Calocera cornea HHB12733]|uniref:Enhancer of mRNA-decapping protein 4 WD40 repeat region domain-containing protein n=1 Tax=Calocera cornea HHB12733 TaxID=1353952 RepID=A0A165FGL8_9BASI|nr:hypothetical protein CALCODRAFT_517943 [Calocera cornea HHB12733]